MDDFGVRLPPCVSIDHLVFVSLSFSFQLLVIVFNSTSPTLLIFASPLSEPKILAKRAAVVAHRQLLHQANIDFACVALFLTSLKDSS